MARSFRLLDSGAGKEKMPGGMRSGGRISGRESSKYRSTRHRGNPQVCSLSSGIGPSIREGAWNHLSLDPGVRAGSTFGRRQLGDRLWLPEGYPDRGGNPSGGQSPHPASAYGPPPGSQSLDRGFPPAPRQPDQVRRWVGLRRHGPTHRCGGGPEHEASCWSRRAEFFE